MLKIFRASRSNVVVWAILLLLIVGLAGFGISTGGGGGQSVARVGDARVEADAYARALDQELQALATQIGRQLPMSEARQFGVDRMVLARLLADAALDDEAARLGISAGDEAVQAMVLATPAFQGIDGSFDREAYAFALERAGLTAREFEELLRAETARELIAGSLQSAVAMPAVAGDTLLGYAGETRRLDWLALDASLLPEQAPAPGAAEVEAFYAANPDRYTRPETRRVTYALLEPEALAAAIDVPEDEVRAAYDAAGERFDVPERRIADRIGFGTPEEAAAALARIETGEVDFDALAAERGLSEAAMDQGELTRGELSPEAAEAVFGAEGPGIVGPVPTPLGPSLYRVNAILAASATSFEEARAELRAERALGAARAQIADAAAEVEDMLAGGARLEEIVAESDFEIGTIALDATTTGGLADDPAFRELAEAAEVGVETDLAELASGGLAALRVDAVEPPAPIPLAEVRDRVAADWTAEEIARRLAAFAADLKAELEGGLAFADLAARLGR
ncbi:MAG: SurA N-terminal domain-containing protein, partial [Rhodobacteraceae bacterium]|nr:SurA N-terminal domain-containing protein [Paracoccaceae bacterium]